MRTFTCRSTFLYGHPPSSVKLAWQVVAVCLRPRGALVQASYVVPRNFLASKKIIFYINTFVRRLRIIITETVLILNSVVKELQWKVVDNDK